MPPQLVDRPSTRIATAATGIESAARTWARMDEFEDDDFTSIRRPDTEAVRPDFQVEGDNRPVGRLYALGHVVFVQPKKTQVKGRGRAPATMAAKSRGATPGAPRSVPAAAKPSQAKQGGLSASNSEEGQEVLTLTLAPNPNPNRNRDRSPNRNPSHSPSPNPNPSPSPNPNPNQGGDLGLQVIGRSFKPRERERACQRERERESERERVRESRGRGAPTQALLLLLPCLLCGDTPGARTPWRMHWEHMGAMSVFWVHTAGALGSGGVLSPRVHPRVTGCAMWAVRSS